MDCKVDGTNGVLPRMQRGWPLRLVLAGILAIAATVGARHAHAQERRPTDAPAAPPPDAMPIATDPDAPSAPNAPDPAVDTPSRRESIPSKGPAYRAAERPGSAPLASRRTDPDGPPYSRYGLVAGGVLGVGPIFASGGDHFDGGGIAGLGMQLAVATKHTAFRIDLEGHLGGGTDGFVTRDRVGVWVGPAAIHADGLAISLLVGADGRYSRSNVVEQGRLLAPGFGLDVFSYHGPIAIDVMALGGLSGKTALTAGAIDVDRNAAGAAGGSVTLASTMIYANVRYLRRLGGEWASDFETAICAGAFYAICAEFDHVALEVTPGTSYETARGLFTLGLGYAGRERSTRH